MARSGHSYFVRRQLNFAAVSERVIDAGQISAKVNSAVPGKKTALSQLLDEHVSQYPPVWFTQYYRWIRDRNIRRALA
jgi:hypothetical protein